MPRLKITTGKQSGKTYEVTKATVLGRSDTAQVQLSDTAASREHCKVFEQGGAWIVADLNSRNGIKVNGVQTTRKNLANGDKIVIGETTIVFEAGGGASAAAKEAKEAAFAAARAGTGGPKKGGSAPARAAAAAAAESGVKVSDHVLQFHKVDAKNATILQVDLAQSATMARLFMTLGCVAFLGAVVWLVLKMSE